MSGQLKEKTTLTLVICLHIPGLILMGGIEFYFLTQLFVPYKASKLTHKYTQVGIPFNFNIKLVYNY